MRHSVVPDLDATAVAILADALVEFGSTKDRTYTVLANVAWTMRDFAWVRLSLEGVALSLDLSESSVEAAFAELTERGILRTLGSMYRLNDAYPADRVRRIAASN